jgi:hypothetical protein
MARASRPSPTSILQNTAVMTTSQVQRPISSPTPYLKNSGTNGKSAQRPTQKFSARSSTPILTTPSRHSRTTIASRQTPRQTRTTSRATCTIRCARLQRSEQSSIVSRDIWSGCSWSFWRRLSWRNEGCRSTRSRRVFIPKFW